MPVILLSSCRKHNLDEAKPLIETYLGGLPTIHRTENFRDTKMDIRKGKYTNVFSKNWKLH